MNKMDTETNSYIKVDAWYVKTRCEQRIFRIIKLRRRKDVETTNCVLEHYITSKFWIFIRKIFKKEIPTFKDVWFELKNDSIRNFPCINGWGWLAELKKLRKQAIIALSLGIKEITISTEHADMLYLQKDLTHVKSRYAFIK